jgi:hypothetical protein
MCTAPALTRRPCIRPCIMSSILFLLHCALPTISVNVGNPSATTGWVSQPPTRGTFQLLVSCIVTLFLCVWTSLHLNIPSKNKSTISRLSLKFKWALLAVFAPEWVVYTAWRQWAAARSLCQNVNSIISEKESDSSNNVSFISKSLLVLSIVLYYEEIDHQR